MTLPEMIDEDYAELLQEEAKSDIVAVHEFIIQFSDDEFAIHCFYEGDEDPAFYNSFIRTTIPEVSIRQYVCGGKTKVVACRDYLMAGDYSLAKCAFFLDRDYDDFSEQQVSEDEHTYLTDFYSFESYVVNREFTKNVLRELCSVNSNELSERVLARIDRTVDSFCHKFRPLALWMLACKSAKLKVNFNNAILKNYFSISDDDGSVCVKKNGFSKFKKSTGGPLELIPKVPAYKHRSIVRDNDKRVWLRGKYLLWAYQTGFRSALHNEIARVSSEKKKRSPEERGELSAVRMPASLQAQSCLEMVSGRLPIPPKLNDFLLHKSTMLGLL